MLNTFHISLSATPPCFCRKRNSGGTCHEARSTTASRCSPYARGRLPGKPAPVMCAMPRTTRLRLYAPSTFITAFV